jgi:mannose/fructose-specific phosphotransferase system component IIA
VFDQLSKESKDFIRYPFSTLGSISIDTEGKAWQKRCDKESNNFNSYYIDNGCVGRGNNWAAGFYDNDNIDEIMERYRKIAERNYQYDGMLLIHSLAGGTGSGLGSRLTQEIRQDYGKSAILTSSFAPFTTGETAVQNYNSMLSLNTLQENADLIGFFPNDEMLNCATRTKTLDHQLAKKSNNGIIN